MLFCSTDLAARIERAEAGLIREGARPAGRRLGTACLVRDVAGGVAACTEPGSPLNKVAGLGFGGPVSADTWTSIEREFDARGADVRVEISTLADPSIAAELTRRGYDLVGFENVLGCVLPAPGSAASSKEVSIESLAAEHEATWLDVVVTGFAHPDSQGVPSDESYPRELVEHVIRDMTSGRDFHRYLARVDGALAGGASMRASEGVAQLCGAATLPELRRRGAQRALLHARLGDAARLGCDIAVVTTQPGSKSQENVQKLGFGLLYARTVLVRRHGQG